MKRKQTARWWQAPLATMGFCALLLAPTGCDNAQSTTTGTETNTMEAPATPQAFDARVTALLNEMTVEEKVGQMTQVTIDLILKEGEQRVIDPERLRTAIVEKKVGSILNVNGGAYPLELWHDIITQIQDVATKETRLKVPILYGIDAIHGATYIEGGTLFPHNIGMAATRDPGLVKVSAEITALETRASGIRWNFDPVLGLGRQPLWSRFEETFGEDRNLATAMGLAAIKGYEGDDLSAPTSVASCMKHYIAYSVPASGKDRTPSYVPERVLRETFLPPFADAVKAGSSTLMINSGEINGIPVHGSHYLLTEILRGELGFKGVAVTDWEDIKRLNFRHRVAATPKEAVKLGIMAGIDMSMVPFDYTFYDYLVELVNEGEVPIWRIDEAVGRILELKLKLGLLDNAYPEEEVVSAFGKPEYAETALEAAQQTATLLSNNGVLPLKGTERVLLAGPGANNLGAMHGSWSYVWQGNNEAAYPESTQTLAAAFNAAFEPGSVTCRSAAEYSAATNYNASRLRQDARNADVIVLALGEPAYAESPGVINDLKLDQAQLDLAEAALATGKPVVVVLFEGRPRVLGPLAEKAAAVLQMYRPGSKGGQATVDVLLGKVNPSGRLPYTYPRNSGDIVLYDHKTSEAYRELTPGNIDTGGYQPQWPFGHGLSYSSFEYSGLSLNGNTLQGSGTLTATVTVTNTGKVAGHHSVELYSKDHYASVTPPERQLQQFQKVMLEPGTSQELSFTIAAEDLALVNMKGDRVTEPGAFSLMVGNQTAEFEYKK